jgi:hypothetical protein
VAYLEAVAGISRRGEDGRSHEAARLVQAAFLHSTSRAQDPQLHLHTILLNVGVRADGTTGTLEPKGLYRHQMAAGALFRAELAARLETELGLRARREQRAFELLGVDPELIAFFSKRRAQIEAELARRGQSGGRAAERANFATRAVKVARPREELFAEWQRIGHEHHWSAKELSWMIDAPFPARHLEWERAAASTEALAQLTASQSHFCRRQIVQAVAECAQGRGLGAEVALRLSQELLQSPELVRLGEHRGEVHYTTREILALEKSVLTAAEAMQEHRQFLSTHWTEEAIARYSHLTGEQTEALRHLCAARGGFPRASLLRAASARQHPRGLQKPGKCCLPPADAGVASPSMNPTQKQSSLNRGAKNRFPSSNQGRLKYYPLLSGGTPRERGNRCSSCSVRSWFHAQR